MSKEIFVNVDKKCGIHKINLDEVRELLGMYLLTDKELENMLIFWIDYYNAVKLNRSDDEEKEEQSNGVW